MLNAFVTGGHLYPIEGLPQRTKFSIYDTRESWLYTEDDFDSQCGPNNVSQSGIAAATGEILANRETNLINVKVNKFYSFIDVVPFFPPQKNAGTGPQDFKKADLISRI